MKKDSARLNARKHTVSQSRYSKNRFSFLFLFGLLTFMEKNIPLILKELAKYATGPASVENSTPFQVLVATLLSQRTRDANTEKASKKLFTKYPNAKALAKAPTKKIEELIKGTGFFKVKAKRVKEISRLLVKNYQGAVPNERNLLEALPGIGPKTSACTLVYAFQKPAICVDTHVHRISNRLGLVKTKTPEQTEVALTKLLPKKYWLKLNHSMVRFGQKVCLPQKPRHWQCRLREQCNLFKQERKRAKS